MKYYLLFILLVSLASCSSSEDANIDSGEVIVQKKNIEFIIEEVWKPALYWTDEKIKTFNWGKTCIRDSGSKITGVDVGRFSTTSTNFSNSKRTHFSLDTLFIELKANNDAFYIGFTSVASSRQFSREPRTIGHIEFINFDSEKKIFVDRYEMTGDNINYFSSNLSEDLINSMTLEGNSGFKTCNNFKLFHKQEPDDYLHMKRRRKFTVPADERNLALKVGDTIGAQKGIAVGDGWDSMWNFSDYFVITEKVLLRY